MYCVIVGALMSALTRALRVSTNTKSSCWVTQLLPHDSKSVQQIRTRRRGEARRGRGRCVASLVKMGAMLSFGCDEGISHLCRLFNGNGASTMGQLFWVMNRCFRVRRELGEGGYAYVYLVAEEPAGSEARGGGSDTIGELFALKRVLIQSKEQLREVEREVKLHSLVCRHKNIITLVESEVVDTGNSREGDRMRQAMLLFPAYEKVRRCISWKIILHA